MASIYPDLVPCQARRVDGTSDRKPLTCRRYNYPRMARVPRGFPARAAVNLH